MESEVADHCLTFSLSDPKNSCFQGKCNHNHDEVCYECNKLTGVLSTIKEVCAELQSEEERDDSICLVAQAEKDILAWKAHQRITGEQTKVPTFGFYAASKISVDKLHSTLEMGWALKTTRSRTHFTEEQRKFLTEQFLIGEECGKKADPQQVSQEMRRVRDEKAARIFSGKDILSPQQVAGFFSRLAARIRKTSATSNKESGSEDEEQCAVEAEALHSHLREVVSEEIALRHPIVALSRNICSLVHTKKLSTLTVAVLRDICEDIGLNVDDITEKRKKPLISRITQVVKECSCARV